MYSRKPKTSPGDERCFDPAALFSAGWETLPHQVPEAFVSLVVGLFLHSPIEKGPS
jgi:hypothetical protein